MGSNIANLDNESPSEIFGKICNTTTNNSDKEPCNYYELEPRPFVPSLAVQLVSIKFLISK